MYVMLFVHYALLCMSCSLYTTLFYVCHALCTLSLCTHCFSEPQLFTVEQWQTLLKYFDEYGMTSTHRRNSDLIQRCATEVGTTTERVKVMNEV